MFRKFYSYSLKNTIKSFNGAVKVQYRIMKITYIYDAIYPWTKGGVERRVYEVKDYLRGGMKFTGLVLVGG